jgi:(p)ppGpp synthase/HD superfamily hydrolase
VHAGQKRNYTFEPYFKHLEAVANIVAAAGADEATIAAAYLHDTLEDTDTTVAELIHEFGVEVTMIVVELTDQYTHAAYPKINRATRKAMETERLATVSAKAKLIKRADLADNTVSIVDHDPRFATVYLREKHELLKVL